MLIHYQLTLLSPPLPSPLPPPNILSGFLTVNQLLFILLVREECWKKSIFVKKIKKSQTLWDLEFTKPAGTCLLQLTLAISWMYFKFVGVMRYQPWLRFVINCMIKINLVTWDISFFFVQEASQLLEIITNMHPPFTIDGRIVTASYAHHDNPPKNTM